MDPLEIRQIVYDDGRDKTALSIATGAYFFDFFFFFFAISIEPRHFFAPQRHA
jgi:hypothetical protein